MTILQGLKIIDRAELPHPEWEFVRTSKDLLPRQGRLGYKRFPKIKDYVGWTIRTVDIINGPWENLYVNRLPKKQVPGKVDEFQKRLRGRALFVIYPSWKWKRAGTLLIEKDRVVIEAIRGAIVDLMRHGKVEGAYYFNTALKLVSTVGDARVITLTERKKILQAVRKIRQKNVILEWGITTQNKFIFYRIEDIREAGKLLLKKYS
ncbi:MAG: hypothetical protein V1685_00310 [Parcubacteria group bacterium]